MTPTGVVHRAGRGVNPYSGKVGDSLACGRARARYLVPTDAPVTCKRCGADTPTADLAERAEAHIAEALALADFLTRDPCEFGGDDAWPDDHGWPDGDAGTIRHGNLRPREADDA
jgi:hypothetical protein